MISAYLDPVHLSPSPSVASWYSAVLSCHRLPGPSSPSKHLQLPLFPTTPLSSFLETTLGLVQDSLVGRMFYLFYFCHPSTLPSHTGSHVVQACLIGKEYLELIPLLPPSSAGIIGIYRRACPVYAVLIPRLCVTTGL